MKSILCPALLFLCLAWTGTAATRVEEVPEKGLQPEVATGPEGTIHLVYLRGEVKAADVRYTWRKPGEPWQTSEPVDSPAAKGIAVGSIRGPQVALGANGTVHVLWNGVSGGEQAPQAPLWYARKKAGDRVFGKPRDLLADTVALDGGASIASDARGKVFVVWHGNLATREPEEKQRRVFVRTSTDEGETFGHPEPANRDQPGVCACCSLRALAGPEDGLRIFFRNALTTENRSMTLLSQKAGGWTTKAIEPWKTAACPMSSAALTAYQNQLLGVWETAGQIRAGWISAPGSTPVTVAASSAKHPTLAISPQGRILIAWVEGSGWNRGGSAVWQEYDAKLQPQGPPGKAAGVPAWGRVAGYAEPKGDFVILQ
jgi:hypothetical protein